MAVRAIAGMNPRRAERRMENAQLQAACLIHARLLLPRPRSKSGPYALWRRVTCGADAEQTKAPERTLFTLARGLGIQNGLNREWKRGPNWSPWGLGPPAAPS